MNRKTLTAGPLALALAATGALAASPAASAHEQAGHSWTSPSRFGTDHMWFGHWNWKMPTGTTSEAVAALIATYEAQAAEAKAAREKAQAAFETWKTQAAEARSAAYDLRAGWDTDQRDELQAAYDQQKAEARAAWEALDAARAEFGQQAREARQAALAVWKQVKAERRAAQDARDIERKDHRKGDDPKSHGDRDKVQASSVKSNATKSVRVASWSKHDSGNRNRDNSDRDHHRWGDRDRQNRDHRWGDRDGDRHRGGRHGSHHRHHQ